MDSRLDCQKAPSAKKRIKTAPRVANAGAHFFGQKASSAKRCIKTCCVGVMLSMFQKDGQKASSAKRCIKTIHSRNSMEFGLGSQKAPSAKRCIKTHGQAWRQPCRLPWVRKHRAPNGALRRHKTVIRTILRESQKAPSAKRCIKTRHT